MHSGSALFSSTHKYTQLTFTHTSPKQLPGTRSLPLDHQINHAGLQKVELKDQATAASFQASESHSRIFAIVVSPAP